MPKLPIGFGARDAPFSGDSKSCGVIGAVWSCRADDDNRYAMLSDEQLQVVHAACETFEQALQNEEPICIEDCIAAASEKIRTPLFRELLAIEVERPVPRDGLPRIALYHARFPERSDDIERVFQEISKARPADDLPKKIGRYRVENVLGTGA